MKYPTEFWFLETLIFSFLLAARESRDEPWQRVNHVMKTVQIFPKSGVDVIECDLDFMYHDGCRDGYCFCKVGELSHLSDLRALRLAGHLNIPDLHDHVMDNLFRMVSPGSACVAEHREIADWGMRQSAAEGCGRIAHGFLRV